MAENQIRIIVQRLKEVTTKTIKKIVLDATANLIEKTPVDTGWARANWIPKIADTFKGTAGSAGHPDPGAQQAGIAFVASRYRLEDGFVTITNNVPYIQALNCGHSQQAPVGFVQAAIIHAVKGANR